jgi:hypothetical protein
LPEYQLQGELVISVPRHRHLRAKITAGKGWGRRGGDMLPEYQLQGELVISVPRHRHPCATITVGKGWGIWLEVYTLRPSLIFICRIEGQKVDRRGGVLLGFRVVQNGRGIPTSGYPCLKHNCSTVDYNMS